MAQHHFPTTATTTTTKTGHTFRSIISFLATALGQRWKCWAKSVATRWLHLRVSPTPTNERIYFAGFQTRSCCCFFSARRRKKTEKPFPPAVVKTRATFNWWTKRKTAKTRGRFCVSVKLGNTPNTLESENGCKMRVNGPGAEKLGRKKNNPVNDGAINE